MEGTSWADIQKLASDFQRIQLGEASKKLSDRNCIELVSSLRRDGIIDIVYSTDGKEYITRRYLKTQICNEAQGSGGRIDLTNLADILGVEYQHIEDAVRVIVAEDETYVIKVGQLISAEYVRSVCDKINTWLVDEGTLTIGQITKAFDLPSDYLLQEVNDAISKGVIRCIRDSLDGQRIYTSEFIARQKALTRGILSAITSPFSLKQLVLINDLHGSLLFDCIDELVQAGHVCGSIIGGRQLDRAVFVPSVYRDAVARWVTQQFAQNGYVEVSAVRKLGWTEDVAKLLEHDEPIVLANCFLDKELWEGYQANIQAALEKNGWVDVMEHMDLHNVFTKEDCTKMIDSIVGGKKKKRGAGGLVEEEVVVCENSHLCYPGRIQSAVIDLFSSEIKTRAERRGPELIKQIKTKENIHPSEHDDISSSTVVDGKKKGGRGGKKGGKSAKSEIKSKQSEADSSSDSSIDFMTCDEIKEFLSENWQSDCPEVVLDEICERLKPVLNSSFRECVESVFLSSDSGSKNSMKKSHTDFEEKYIALFQNIYMFDSCVGQYFEGTTADQLRGLLTRGFCTDLVNLAVSYVGGVDINSKLTPKVRDATIYSLPHSAKETFQRLVASLAVKDNLSEFLSAAEETAGLTICGVSVRYPDKKSRAQLVAKYVGELKDQLAVEDDAARSLVLVLLLAFSHCSEGAMLHASGKFVPQIVMFLRGKLDASLYQNISLAQGLVMKKLTEKKGDAEDEGVAEELSKVIAELKNDISQLG